MALPRGNVRVRAEIGALGQTTRTSVHGAINILELAKESKARILQASTPRSTAILKSIRTGG